MTAESGQYARSTFAENSATFAHQILDSLLEGCQLISPDWMILYLNQAAANQVLKSTEQLLGRSLMDCFPGVESTATFGVLQRCMNERQPDRTVSAFIYPSGSYGRFELRFVPVPEGVCVLSLDVAEGSLTKTAGQGTIRTLSKSDREKVDAVSIAARTAGELPLVLVIDDNAEMSRFIAKHLSKQYRISVAFDGQEGLRMARELRPDLILTDTMMPVMTGEELVAGVRSSSELDSIPILVLSAMADDEVRVKLLRSGAQDCITKPFAMAELRARVANLVQSKLAAELVQRTVEHQHLLAEMGVVLANTLDYDETCASVAELATATLADVCILDVLDQDGENHSLKVAHRCAAHASVAAALQRVPHERHLPYLGSSILETQQRLWLNEISPSHLRSVSQNEEHHAALLELAPRAILGLPLQARGHLLGTMVLVRTSPGQPYTTQDVELAEEIARRAAVALDNARLYWRAQHAIQIRDDVLGIVAHDLRNPLSAMLLQLQLFRRGGTEPERRSQASLDAVLREGARLDLFIQDLLDVARIEAGTFTINPEPLFLNELAEEIVTSHRLLAAESSLALLLDAGAAGSVPFSGDRHRLLQALGNILGNAIKFTPAGGTITVRAVARATEVELSVLDTGPGIAAEQLPHLFDRYWQGQTGDRRGTGLGLSIAKAIVDAHGGRIWVETALARGTTFFLALPRHTSDS